MRDQTTEINCCRRGKHRFSFDHCFWSMRDLEDADDLPFQSQADVYDTLGIPVVENALKGFNAAIIAYGQTGSGKSYSIFGPKEMYEKPELEGLIPRACKEIFRRVKQAPAGKTYKIVASMIEIYMEKDLLSQSTVCRTSYRWEDEDMDDESEDETSGDMDRGR
eukprot:gene25477-31623_t